MNVRSLVNADCRRNIFRRWKQEDEELHSFAIITTDANVLVKKIHDRMPVILDKKEEALWLDQRTPLEQVVQLLTPYPADRMEAYPVSTLVNNPGHDTPEIIAPLREYTLSRRPINKPKYRD